MKSSPKPTPLITEIQRFCLQDGPGIRSTVFMKGCPLRCPWCHNPETQKAKIEIYHYPDICTQCGRCVEVCPEGASSIELIDKKPALRFNRANCTACLKCVDACLNSARVTVGVQLTIKQIIQECLSDEPFYKRSGGGVTLSGGDPLLFPQFSFELAKSLKESGVHVAMETSCFADWQVIQPLLDTIDLFIVDVKSLAREKHKKIVGWPVDTICRNIEKLIKAKANVRIHIPIIPGFNDSNEDYLAFLNFISPFATQLAGLDILPFHVYGEGKYTFLGREETYQYKNMKNVSSKQVMGLARALAKAGVSQVSVGGLVGMGSEKGRKPQEKEVLDSVKN